MDGIKYQLAVISDQLAVHAGVLFFWTGLQDGFLGGQKVGQPGAPSCIEVMVSMDKRFVCFQISRKVT